VSCIAYELEYQFPNGSNKALYNGEYLQHPVSFSFLSCISLRITANFSANRPTRNRFHELFRWTHIVLTVAFLLTAYYHQPETTKYPILISISLLAKEWIFRLFKMLLPIPNAKPLVFPGSVVRLTITLPTNPISRFFWKSWTPGSHVRITIPSIGLLQPHPFTIVSLPSDNKIQIYVRSREGFSRRLYERAAAGVVSRTPTNLNVHFEGIYGGKYPSFAKFDVVLLIASGIGITFTVPILKDLVKKVKAIQAQEQECRCKRIGFVWVVKHRG
jgi:predicted ferric reductase